MYRIFKCRLCGKCCSKSPISILSHEEIILKKIAEKLGLPYSSKPGYRLFDRRTKSYVALSYAMDLVDGKCVFLSSDKKCMIQDIYKPLICRSFPYVPKQVRYNIVWSLKIVFATVEYGLSVECPVIAGDQEFISKLLETGFDKVKLYIPREVEAAREMESMRNLLLNLLSELWRKGFIEVGDDPRVDAPIINLYELLRRYNPNLPYILGIDRVLKKL